MPTEDLLLLLFFFGGGAKYMFCCIFQTHSKDKWHPHPLHRPFMSSYTDIILLLTWNKLLLLFFLLPFLGAVIFSGSVSGHLNKSPCGKQECKCTTQKLFHGHCNPAFTWFTLQFTVRNHIYFVILYTTSWPRSTWYAGRSYPSLIRGSCGHSHVLLVTSGLVMYKAMCLQRFFVHLQSAAFLLGES